MAAATVRVERDPGVVALISGEWRRLFFDVCRGVVDLGGVGGGMVIGRGLPPRLHGHDIRSGGIFVLGKGIIKEDGN